MTHQTLSYSPANDAEIISARLQSLLVLRPIDDVDMLRRIDRLDKHFRIYASSVPQIWTPGVIITQEIRSSTELYLPFTDLRAACLRLLHLSCRFDVTTPFLLALTHTWPDFAARLPLNIQQANPARILRKLLYDVDFRSAFIFTLYQPRHYGGAFGRYPGQCEFLQSWLAQNYGRLKYGINCLDAACGSGEGTWELLQHLLAAHLPPGKIHVTGATHEPIELFSAAHGFFPHDPRRAVLFNKRVAPLCDHWQQLCFQREDIAVAPSDTDSYDIILCNGILGGPFFNDYRTLLNVISGLAQRLRPGGILLAANHFHGGWKQSMPDAVINRIFAEAGLKSIDVTEGVGGQRNE